MKIDVTKIEGYENMTPEEKVAALEAVEYHEPDMSQYVPKAIADKYASEAAENKRKLNERLSEEERIQAEREAEIAALRSEAEAMRQERQMAEIKANYLAVGYDEALAQDTAKAVIEGDIARSITNLKKFLEAHDKAHEADLIAKTPRPTGSGATGTKTPITKEEILNERDPEKRQALINENRALFGLPD